MNNKTMRFRQYGLALFLFRKKVDKMFENGKITKREKNKIKNKILNEWDKLYNQYSNVNSSVKKSFDLLYA